MFTKYTKSDVHNMCVDKLGAMFDPEMTIEAHNKFSMNRPAFTLKVQNS